MNCHTHTHWGKIGVIIMRVIYIISKNKQEKLDLIQIDFRAVYLNALSIDYVFQISNICLNLFMFYAENYFGNVTVI